MMMPGRKYTAGSGYRYGFNGQEKEKDLNENITTALFWEYDSRIGRRWNTDPKPNIALSPYSCFGLNPIAYMDPMGDTLGIPSSGEKSRINSENDIKSLIVNKDNLEHLKFSDDGAVTLVGDKQSILRAANSDKGFRLIYELVTITKHLFYSASESVAYKEKDLKTGIESKTFNATLTKDYPDGSIISHAATIKNIKNSAGVDIQLSDVNKVISNLAMTPSGEEPGPTQDVPSRNYMSGGDWKRYDGTVAIAPGEFYNMVGGSKIVVSRASLIYHELVENLFRVLGSKYLDAHATAQEMEGDKIGGDYGNPSPGVTPQFFHFKK